MTWAARIPTLAGLRYPQASFVLDFANNYYRGSGAQGSSPSALPGYNFTRALAAYAEDTAGNLIQFASGAPRITNKGVLIEPQATNSIRNSTPGNGATVGVVGSGGVVGTNWSVSVSGPTVAVLGSGTEGGLPYLDVRVSGTSLVGEIAFLFEGGTVVAASSGQTWTYSQYIRLAGGDLTNITATQLVLYERNNVGSALSNTTVTATLTETRSRPYVTRTLNQATTAFVSQKLILVPVIGLPVDFTLRIFPPQMEQGSVPTSYIPTTSASVTRPADVFYYSTTLYQAAQTVAAQADKSPSAAAPRIIGGEIGARTALYQANPTNAIGTYNGTTVLNKIATLASTNYSAASWDAAGRKVTFNGATPASDANTMSDWGKTYIGSDNGSSQFYGAYIQRIAIYPFAASDAQLQSISSGNF